MIELIVKNQVIKEFDAYQDAGQYAFDQGLTSFMIRDLNECSCDRYDNPSRSDWYNLGVDYITLYGDEGTDDLY